MLRPEYGAFNYDLAGVCSEHTEFIESLKSAHGKSVITHRVNFVYQRVRGGSTQVLTHTARTTYDTEGQKKTRREAQLTSSVVTHTCSRMQSP